TSPFVYGFIGDSSTLPARVEHGTIWLDDRATGLKVDGSPEGQGSLYFRPHDVVLVDGCGGCIAGVVSAVRRVAGHRRVELAVGGGRERVEIELPADQPVALGGRIAFRPTKWRFYPDAAAPAGAASGDIVPEPYALTGS